MSMSDIEKCYNVKARHSLCVLGITDNDTDDDIIATFENYGVIVKVVRVASPTEQTGQPIIIVEFDAHTPVTLLEPNFPLEIKSARNPAVAWYADNIKVLAQPPSQSHAQAQRLSIESSDDSDNAIPEEVSSDNSDFIPKRYIKRQPLKKPKSKSRVLISDRQPDPAVRKKTPKPAFNTLSNDDLNPPEIQRIVVEHVIKNDAFSAQTHSKWLRSFSGKVPKPPGEADFDTWCLHVDLLLQDSLPIDIQRRKILESLLPPASDVVKQLGSTAPPRDYVKLLDSAYGLVEDGDEIFARFLSTNQDPGEKASDFLQRLQTLLSTAVKRNGLKQSSADRQLLKQFQRGCWDHSLILTLQLEAKAKTPPDFAELLLLLRTEEDRRAAKLDRMQRHLGSSKHKAAIHKQSVVDMSPYSDSSVLQTYISETEALRKQVADLQMQLRSSKSEKKKKHEFKLTEYSNTVTPKLEMQAQQVTAKPPKPWFCFRCGEDGHIARTCEGSINKVLVDRKYKELKAKQDEWKVKNGVPLNQTGFQ